MWVMLTGVASHEEGTRKLALGEGRHLEFKGQSDSVNEQSGPVLRNDLPTQRFMLPFCFSENLWLFCSLSFFFFFPSVRDIYLLASTYVALTIY